MRESLITLDGRLQRILVGQALACAGLQPRREGALKAAADSSLPHVFAG
jgi:hypothetical protein